MASSGAHVGEDGVGQLRHEEGREEGASRQRAAERRALPRVPPLGHPVKREEEEEERGAGGYCGPRVLVWREVVCEREHVQREAAKDKGHGEE